MQDRNIFFEKKKCQQKQLTVDHIATRCEERHDELVKCVHLHMARRYGFTNQSKISGYKPDPVLQNQNATIKADKHIATHSAISHNKPDIFIHDKANNEIIIIEVGITNAETLVKVEIEKARKYTTLAEELRLQLKATRTTIIPIVISWDGLVTRHHKKYLEKLNIPTNIQAYLQTVAIKKTAEIIVIDGKESQQSHS